MTKKIENMNKAELEKHENKLQEKALWRSLEADPEVQCPKCGYGWIPRVKQPKSCPRCKSRLDNK